MLVLIPELGGGVLAAALLMLNCAGVRFPTDAVIVYAPAVPFAVNAGATAMPCALVIAVALAPLPANMALAPLDGALKVTVIPLIGFDEPSSTLT